MAVTAIVLAAVAAAILYVLLNLLTSFQNSKGTKFLKRFPQPPNIPILGSILELNVPNEEMTKKFMFDWPIMYGPRFGIRLGPRIYFTSTKYTDAEKLLTSSVHITKGDEYKFLGAWLGEGLLTSTGHKWFKRRKLLTPSFHFKILEEFLQVFNYQSKIFMDILKEDADDGRKELEICEYITRCTLDTICETAMGKRLNIQKIKDSPYVRAVYGINGLVQYRTARPWLFPDLFWKLSPAGRRQKRYLEILHGFTNSVICERKAEMKIVKEDIGNVEGNDIDDVFITSKKRPVAFLDLLIQHQVEHPGELSDVDIREEVDTFMFEGHDTTAASLSWTIHLLGAHPEYQQTAYEELVSIFGDDKERPITSQDLHQMKFLECCIKESLRLYPSVPFIDRLLTEDLVLDEHTTIPKGCNFPLFLLQVHRNAEIYPEPEAFKPERFFAENSVGRHPFAYIPFSAGPRNCIGQKFAMMEEKVVIANVLRNFRIEALDKREDIVMMTEVILRPRDGLRVRLIPRCSLEKSQCPGGSPVEE